MMKRLMLLLLALMLTLPAACCGEAADSPVAPFILSVPETVEVIPGTGGASQTLVNGTTRIVAMTLSRVPDENGDHAAALMQLMAQFSPDAQEHAPLSLAPGFYGLAAVTPEALEGLNGMKVEQVTVMVLWQTELQGELLILSGYDMAGDGAAALEMITQLLTGATVNGMPVMPTKAEETETESVPVQE